MTEEESGVDPATLKDKTYDLYGVDGNVFVIGIGSDVHAYEVIEDADDGYRSSMDRLAEVPTEKAVVPHVPIAKVTVVEADDTDDCRAFDGWKLVGEDGYEWLRFGTSDTDDYYPSFVFTFNPRGPA